MRRIVVTLIVLVCLVLSAGMFAAQAATEDEIEGAINDGLTWLVGQQHADGSWYDYEGNDTAATCLVLVKLQERAYELGHDSPFDPNYEYAENVERGWGFVFNAARVVKQDPLPVQTHGDPDTNGNGYGIYFQSGSPHPTYTTGICTMALTASGTPNRPNDGGLDFDGDTNADTFLELAQEAVDWLAFAQVDSGIDEGGWRYEACDGSCSADQSNSGYAVLGVQYGDEFGCTVPDWVRTELDVYIDYIQCDVAGADYGGSGYDVPCGWVNELKTGNLIFEMTFVGDDPSEGRFQDALDYMERHWQDANTDPGWGYDVLPANYQAMYCLMKGLEFSRIDLLDTDGDGNRDNDWFNQEPPAAPAQDFASVLVAQQHPDGYWNDCCWGERILGTAWALLTLEKVAPPPPVPVGGLTMPPLPFDLLVPMLALGALAAIVATAVVLKKLRA
ncbi:MAG: hypothetical protein PVH80_07565 [Anaerolineae bacterium]|jgi:hypothetical protein